MELVEVEVDEDDYCEECDNKPCYGAHFVRTAESRRLKKEEEINRLINLLLQQNIDDLKIILDRVNSRIIEK